MSMNLCAAVDSEKIQLWQTSTQISYTILPSHYGMVTGKKAQRALERYIEWVRHSVNGRYNSIEEVNERRDQVKEHIAYVESFLKYKALRVWVM